MRVSQTPAAAGRTREGGDRGLEEGAGDGTGGGKSCNHLIVWFSSGSGGRGLRMEIISLHRLRRSAGSGNSAGKGFSGRFGKTATWC